MLIAFTGKAGSGKDTACEYLRTKIEGSTGITLGFSDPLKKGVAAMFGIPLEMMEDPVKKEEIIPHLGFSPRKALQVIATEGVRNHLGPDVWIKLLDQEYKNCIEDSIILIKDLRFDNEAEWVKSKGGYVVKLIRNYSSTAAKHISEQGIDHNLVSLTIFNLGDIDHFHKQLDSAYAQLCIDREASKDRVATTNN